MPKLNMKIFSHFREIVRGRTAILISHRFTNVSLADRIIVLCTGGRIAEAGPHKRADEGKRDLLQDVHQSEQQVRQG